MKEILRNEIDFFAKSISIYYDGSQKVVTKFGIISSILYIIIALTILIINIVNICKRDNPNFYDSALDLEELQNINLNKDLFYISFGLEDQINYNYFIDETIYNIEAKYIEQERNGNKWSTILEENIDLERCQLKNFGKDFQNQFIDYPLNYTYCLKNINYTLKGNYKFDKISFFKISVNKCSNSTNNKKNCKPKEYIDNILEGGMFAINLENIDLNPKNFKNPTIPVREDFPSAMSASNPRKSIFYMQIVNIETDTGLFFENFKSKKYLKYSRKESFYYSPNNRSNLVYSAIIQLENKIKVQKRIYKKLTDAFASTGGLLSCLSIIFSLILSLPIKSITELEIINKIFKFDLKTNSIVFNRKKIIPFSSSQLYHNKMSSGTLFKNNNLSMSKGKEQPPRNKVSSYSLKANDIGNNKFIILDDKSFSCLKDENINNSINNDNFNINKENYNNKYSELYLSTFEKIFYFLLIFNKRK